MRIITISREFSSGGRELGKRMADLLEIDYYDKEIINTIAQNKDLDSAYVEKALENHAWRAVPLTYRNSFVMTPAFSAKTSLLVEEKNVIEGIAKAGKDCIIVGRNADVLLREYKPFNIFVCAEMQAKLNRCVERAPEGEKLSRKELEQKMGRIDKARKNTREMISGSAPGDKSAYHIIVNTTDWTIKELTPAVVEFTNHFFRRTI